jgi:hypothetical protein
VYTDIDDEEIKRLHVYTDIDDEENVFLVVHVHVTSLDIYDTGLQNGTL